MNSKSSWDIFKFWGKYSDNKHLPDIVQTISSRYFTFLILTLMLILIQATIFYEVVSLRSLILV